MSKKVMLEFRENPQSGVPQLEDPNGVFDRAELQPMERELNARYEALTAGGNGQVVTFQARVVGLPAQFRVWVKPGARKRIPTLVLEPVTGSPVQEPAGSTEPWQTRFATEAAELFRRVPLGRAEQAVTGFVLEEVRSLAAERPGELLLLLLAGYLHVAEGMCQREAPDRCGLYALVARVLDDVCGEALPCGVTDGLRPLPSSELQPARMRRPWASRLLAWLLGIPEGPHS